MNIIKYARIGLSLYHLSNSFLIKMGVYTSGLIHFGDIQNISILFDWGREVEDLIGYNI